MNLLPIAALLIRLSSLLWFFGAVRDVSRLPLDFYGVAHYRSGFYASEREVDLIAELLCLFVNVVIGVGLILFSRPLARVFTRGLAGRLDRGAGAQETDPMGQSIPEGQSVSWPPAPRPAEGNIGSRA